MAIFTLATGSDPFYDFTATLDGVNYAFDFRYNQREACWYFSIGLNDGTDLANGVKVVCGPSLLSTFVDDRLPPGALIAMSSTADNSPPGLSDLAPGARVSIIYADAAEIASL